MSEKVLGQIGLDKLIQLIKSALSDKVDKVTGKDLSTNDYTTDEKNKLAIALIYKGTKATIAELPNSGNTQGDIWHVTADSGEYLWNGSSWELIGNTTGTTQSDWNQTDTSAGSYINNKPTNLSDFTNDSGFQTAAQVSSAISSAIAGVYTPKGTVTFANLPAAAASNLGWVYNISDAFTTTASFVEGAGASYSAGSNVVCVETGINTYAWDVLGGTFDFEELTANEVQTLWNGNT